jgi:hypothetical protein
MAAMTLSDALPYLSKELPLDDLYASINFLNKETINYPFMPI